MQFIIANFALFVLVSVYYRKQTRPENSMKLDVLKSYENHNYTNASN